MSPHRSATPGHAARILVVDDHPVVREGLRDLIESEPGFTVCGEAEDAAKGLATALELRPDLVLVDVSLKGRSGIELIQDLRSHELDTKVLVVSMHEESLYAERSLRAGAQGFINKEEAGERIIEAIRSVLAGHVYLSRKAADRALGRVSGSTSRSTSHPLERLSNRELEVFERIGGGMSTREIAEQLNLSVKTIESHRENIKSKLDLRSGAELVSQAVRWRLERG